MDNGLPPLGGDTRVKHPMTPVAGGSGVNTATHLSALCRDFLEETDEKFMDITLQTAINENDYYGRVISDHAKKNNFELINCSKGTKDKKDQESEKNVDAVPKSTGHCIVMVDQGERSFVTHLGAIETFKASHTVLHELVNFRTADPSFINHHHHIHVAGFYNMPGFSQGNLKKRLKLVREKRRAQSTGMHTFTTTVSLVPQYDATEEWDGGLVDDVLPLVDFLILNSLEAGRITNVEVDEKDCGGDVNRAIVFAQWADFFWEKSPLTHVVVTLGRIGAVCLYQGECVASMASPKRYKKPIDPTGAGDAFAAGFLFGVMNWRKQHGHEDCAEIGSVLEGSWNNAIIEGMRYGCCTGTSCVSRPGASVPAPKDEILKFLTGEMDPDDEEEIEDLPRTDSVDGEESEDESYYPDGSDSDNDSYSSSYSDDDESISHEDVFEEKKLST